MMTTINMSRRTGGVEEEQEKTAPAGRDLGGPGKSKRGTAKILGRDAYQKQILNARNRFIRIIRTIVSANERAPPGFFTSVVGLFLQEWPEGQGFRSEGQG